VVIYYAGHGVQDDKGSNYLIPVKADLKSQLDLQFEALKLDDITAMIDQLTLKIAVIVLDACRDNPLPAVARSGKRGLARVDEQRAGLMWSIPPARTRWRSMATATTAPLPSPSPTRSASPAIDIRLMIGNVGKRVYGRYRRQAAALGILALGRELLLAGPAPATSAAVAPTAPAEQATSNNQRVGPPQRRPKTRPSPTTMPY